jgi:hypothetical protein
MKSLERDDRHMADEFADALRRAQAEFLDERRV